MNRIRLVIVIAVLPILLAADQKELTQDKTALAPLQRYIGQWRGVGQPRRGSTRGAWREQSDWIWKFTDREAMLRFNTSGARYFAEGVLRAGSEPNRYELVATTSAGQKVKYSGGLGEDGRLVLVADDAPPAGPARISIRQVARGDRLLVLYERGTPSDRYTRLAEVGYTREGSNFGKGTNYVECVVTGGLGTIAVSYQGKTYYVCCSGCRDYFNENPAEVLAAYRQQQKEAAAKAKQQAADEKSQDKQPMSM